MEHFQTDRFQLSMPEVSSDETIFGMVIQSIAEPNKYTSNFDTIFSASTFSSLEAFTEYRRKTIRMNHEGQQCMLDIATASGDIVGFGGFVRVNRLVSAREATLCITLQQLDGDQLAEIFYAIYNIAVMRPFYLSLLRIPWPDEGRSETLTQFIETLNFVSMNDGDYGLCLDDVSRGSETIGIHRQRPGYRTTRECKYSDKDIVGLPCVDCPVRFSMTDGEQKFFFERGLTFPKRCQRCRIRKHLAMNPPGSGRLSAYTSGERTRDRTRTSSTDSTASSMMASMTSPTSSTSMPSVPAPFSLRQRSSDYISPPRSRTSSMDGSFEEQPYFSAQYRGGSSRNRYSQHHRLPVSLEGQRQLQEGQKMCSYWLHGSCRFGAECRNTHGTTSSLSMMSKRHEHEQKQTPHREIDDRTDEDSSSVASQLPSPQGTQGSLKCADGAQKVAGLESLGSAEQSTIPHVPHDSNGSKPIYTGLLVEMLNSAPASWLLMIRYREVATPRPPVASSADVVGGMELRETEEEEQVPAGVVLDEAVITKPVDDVTPESYNLLAGSDKPAAGKTAADEPKYFSSSMATAIIRSREAHQFSSVADLHQPWIGLTRVLVDESFVDVNTDLLLSYHAQRNAQLQAHYQQYYFAQQYYQQQQLQQQQLQFQQLQMMQQQQQQSAPNLQIPQLAGSQAHTYDASSQMYYQPQPIESATMYYPMPMAQGLPVASAPNAPATSAGEAGMPLRVTTAQTMGTPGRHYGRKGGRTQAGYPTMLPYAVQTAMQMPTQTPPPESYAGYAPTGAFYGPILPGPSAGQTAAPYLASPVIYSDPTTYDPTAVAYSYGYIPSMSPYPQQYASATIYPQYPAASAVPHVSAVHSMRGARSYGGEPSSGFSTDATGTTSRGSATSQGDARHGYSSPGLTQGALAGRKVSKYILSRESREGNQGLDPQHGIKSQDIRDSGKGLKITYRDRNSPATIPLQKDPSVPLVADSSSAPQTPQAGDDSVVSGGHVTMACKAIDILTDPARQSKRAGKKAQGRKKPRDQVAQQTSTDDMPNQEAARSAATAATTLVAVVATGEKQIQTLSNSSDDALPSQRASFSLDESPSSWSTENSGLISPLSELSDGNMPELLHSTLNDQAPDDPPSQTLAQDFGEILETIDRNQQLKRATHDLPVSASTALQDSVNVKLKVSVSPANGHTVAASIGAGINAGKASRSTSNANIQPTLRAELTSGENVEDLTPGSGVSNLKKLPSPDTLSIVKQAPQSSMRADQQCLSPKACADIKSEDPGIAAIAGQTEIAAHHLEILSDPNMQHIEASNVCN